MSIVEFLLARIGEAEAAALEMRSALEHKGPNPRFHDTVRLQQRQDWPTFWRAFDRYPDPARVLAECEAKGRIVDAYSQAERLRTGDIEGLTDFDRSRMGGEYGALHAVVVHLAAIYADHPDYREEWR